MIPSFILSLCFEPRRLGDTEEKNGNSVTGVFVVSLWDLTEILLDLHLESGILWGAWGRTSQ